MSNVLLRVFLFDHVDLGQQTQDGIRMTLLGLLQDVLDGASNLGVACDVSGLLVEWQLTAPLMTLTDVGIHFTDRQKSKSGTGNSNGESPGGLRNTKSGHSADTKGLTTKSSTGIVRSEVFFDDTPQDTPTLLSKVAFHELMHNKLDLSEHRLHATGGLASPVASETNFLNAQNIRDLAPGLANEHLQDWQ
jgi:hypothetical protein